MENGSQVEGQEVGVLEMKKSKEEIAEHMWRDYNMCLDT